MSISTPVGARAISKWFRFSTLVLLPCSDDEEWPGWFITWPSMGYQCLLLPAAVPGTSTTGAFCVTIKVHKTYCNQEQRCSIFNLVGAHVDWFGFK